MLSAARVGVSIFVEKTDNAMTGIRDTRITNCNTRARAGNEREIVHVVVGLSTKLFRSIN